MRLRRLLSFPCIVVLAFLTPTAAHAAPECDAACQTWVKGALAHQAQARAAAVALLNQVSAENSAANAGDCKAIVAVAQRFFPASAIPTMVRVMVHESSRGYPVQCNPGIRNPTSPDFGLLQINAVHNWRYTRFLWCAPNGSPRWFDAVCNLQVGAMIFNEQGGNFLPAWRGAV